MMKGSDQTCLKLGTTKLKSICRSNRPSSFVMFTNVCLRNNTVSSLPLFTCQGFRRCAIAIFLPALCVPTYNTTNAPAPTPCPPPHFLFIPISSLLSFLTPSLHHVWTKMYPLTLFCLSCSISFSSFLIHMHLALLSVHLFCKCLCGKSGGMKRKEAHAMQCR